MRLLTFLVSFVLLHGAQACLSASRDPPPEDIKSYVRKRALPNLVRTAIRNVRVFDGKAFTNPRTVFIDDDGLIADSIGDIVKVVDAKGQFLIPGLMDAHTHVSGVAALENFTAYGVTTIFNMDCRNYTLCALLQGQAGLASFLTASMAGIGNGSHHAALFPRPASELLYPDTDPETVVANAFNNGSYFLKVVAERNGPSLELQKGLVAATHQRSRRVATHASDLEAYLQAVTSGSDSIQHTCDDGIVSPLLLEQMRARGQFSTPTMELFRQAYSDPAIWAFLRGNASSTDGTTTYANVVQNVKDLHRARVPILAGTDSIGGVAPGLSYPFGVSLHNELVNLVSAGLSPAEALRAATSRVADMYGLKDRGSIQPGWRADLVLLNSNPLVNISNSRDIARVWAGGFEYVDVASGT
ncbi:hypothetical protein F5Y19DRAFT_58761 [Xylariaceae sp. FL1651]|nr:hypothetical protein F5Y19DRAFT_58761 [Xylariaceae sp. FL1651]